MATVAQLEYEAESYMFASLKSSMEPTEVEGEEVLSSDVLAR